MHVFNCVFSEFLLVCLASVNQRAEVTAKVVYMPTHFLMDTGHTPSLNISPALNPPGPGIRKLDNTPIAQSLTLFKMAKSQGVTPPPPPCHTMKAVAYVYSLLLSVS